MSRSWYTARTLQHAHTRRQYGELVHLRDSVTEQLRTMGNHNMSLATDTLYPREADECARMLSHSDRCFALANNMDVEFSLLIGNLLRESAPLRKSGHQYSPDSVIAQQFPLALVGPEQRPIYGKFISSSSASSSASSAFRPPVSVLVPPPAPVPFQKRELFHPETFRRLYPTAAMPKLPRLPAKHHIPTTALLVPRAEVQDRESKLKNDEVCGICMEKRRTTQMVYVVPCDHVFCIGCVRDQLDKLVGSHRGDCAKCRTKIQSIRRYLAHPEDKTPIARSKPISQDFSLNPTKSCSSSSSSSSSAIRQVIDLTDAEEAEAAKAKDFRESLEIVNNMFLNE